MSKGVRARGCLAHDIGQGWEQSGAFALAAALALEGPPDAGVRRREAGKVY